MHGIGTDPEGYYAGTPGHRLRELEAAEAERDVWKRNHDDAVAALFDTVNERDRYKDRYKDLLLLMVKKFGTPDLHIYLSTACLHGQHAYCAACNRPDGTAKEPGQCKFCAAPCVCECGHQ